MKEAVSVLLAASLLLLLCACGSSPSPSFDSVSIDSSSITIDSASITNDYSLPEISVTAPELDEPTVTIVVPDAFFNSEIKGLPYHKIRSADGFIDVQIGKLVKDCISDEWSTLTDLNALLSPGSVSEVLIFNSSENSLFAKAFNPYASDAPLSECLVSEIMVSDPGLTLGEFGPVIGSDRADVSYIGAGNISSGDIVVFNTTAPIDFSVFPEQYGAVQADLDISVSIYFRYVGDMLYNYTLCYDSFIYHGMQDCIAPEEIIDATAEQIATAEETRDTILDRLIDAFDEADLDVTVNKETGEIVMDSNVLFAVSEYNLSSAGKEYLDSFIGVYSSVLLSDEFYSDISYILIEGHTDTSGEFDYNMYLSEKRAETVLKYCIESQANGMTDDIRARFEASAKTKGFSFSRPVLTPEGKVDMAGSRRVCIKFYINLDE